MSLIDTTIRGLFTDADAAKANLMAHKTKIDNLETMVEVLNAEGEVCRACVSPRHLTGAEPNLWIEARSLENFIDRVLALGWNVFGIRHEICGDIAANLYTAGSSYPWRLVIPRHAAVTLKRQTGPGWEERCQAA